MPIMSAMNLGEILIDVVQSLQNQSMKLDSLHKCACARCAFFCVLSARQYCDLFEQLLGSSSDRITPHLTLL